MDHHGSSYAIVCASSLATVYCSGLTAVIILGYSCRFLSISFRPPTQAAVLFKHEPRLAAAAVTRAEENWKRRKSKPQTEAQTLQLVSVWSKSITEADPVQETTPSGQESKAGTKGNTDYLSKINLGTSSVPQSS